MIWILVDSSSVGGIERHIESLARALQRRAIAAQIVLLGEHGDNPWCRQLKQAGLGYRVLPGSILGLWNELRQAGPSLIHTHGYKANFIGRLVARSLRIPVISTYHAGERGAFPVNVYQALDEYSSLLAPRLCVSTEIQHALPYAARLAENFIAIEPAHIAADLPRCVGFVGRMSHEKAPDLFCAIAERCPANVEFHAWGDGPMRADLEAQFGRHVRFHGLVTDMARVWTAIGLLVMPSRAEGLPMAALEALAHGVPILASDVGGLPRLVSDGTSTGWLMKVGDLDGAVTAVGLWDALDVSAQSRIRQACVDHVRSHFSEDVHFPGILDAYRAAGFNLACP